MHESVRAGKLAPAWAGTAPGGRTEGLLDGPDAIPYVGVLLFLLAMYGVAPDTVPITRPLRPALTTGMGAFLFVLVERTFTGRPFRLLWPDSYALLGFFGAVVLSSFTAFWPGLAVLSALEFAKLVVLYFVIVNVVQTRTKLRGLVLTMVVVGSMPALGTVSNYIQGNLVDGRAAWLAKFANPNILAFELTILVPLTVAAMVVCRWWGKVLLSGLLLAYLAAIYFTFSRSGLIALGVIVAVGILRIRGAGLRMLVVGVLILAVALGSQFWEREEDFDGLAGDTTFNQRIVSVQAGIAMFQASPLFGVGMGCAFLGWQEFTPETYDARGEFLMIHNTFVEALAETGLVGFTMLMLAIVAPLWRMRRLARAARAKDAEMYALATAIELSFVGLLVSSLANGYVALAAPYLLMALAASVAIVDQEERLVGAS